MVDGGGVWVDEREREKREKALLFEDKGGGCIERDNGEV